jgi:hypothetical protein
MNHPDSLVWVEALPMLQPLVIPAGAPLPVLAKVAPWLRLILVMMEGLRVANAKRELQQRAVTATVVKRRERVDVNPGVLHLENAKKALPQIDILLQCYLLDLKKK